MNAAPTPSQVAAVGLRTAVPNIPPACRNCKHLVYDSDDRSNAKGEVTLRRVNVRCSMHKFKVALGKVCNAHEFAYSDRSDR